VGFVDIHCHVLYGLDDGAKTREESVEMLEIAARSGTTDIVATPHANSHYAFRPDLIAERIADLAPSSPVRVHPGCDFHLQFDNIEDAVSDPEKYTINRKGYLLVEFPDVGVFPETGTILARLIDAGMTPIISHPERNLDLRRRVDDLASWVEAGSFVQVTAASFTGLFGRAAKQSAFDLLERGLVHFVASDAHDTKIRTTNLSEAFGLLAAARGEEQVRPLFVENPKAVLSGGTIDFELAAPAPKTRKWYQFWTR